MLSKMSESLPTNVIFIDTRVSLYANFIRKLRDFLCEQQHQIFLSTAN